MLKLECPSCGKVFFRSEDLARTVTACPACRANLTFNKEGKCALIKQVKYAREDPKHVQSLFNEMKQHGEPFRRRMQWLSRIYGGRGGYTSEELYKIVTGKTVGGYYIFPFVKGAPPEVNRILERTYRTHREAGDTKVAAAIAAWTKVKQAGYVKVTKPAPVWTKRRYKMGQLKPMQVVNYTWATSMKGLGSVTRGKTWSQWAPKKTVGGALGGLAERGARGLWGAARRHPRITSGVGTFGVGYLTAKELAKRRKRKKGYQLGLEHITPDIKLGLKERLKTRLAAGTPTKKGLAGAGKRLGGTTSMAVKAALIGLIATQILERIGKRRPGMAWMPDVRSDIELSGPGYETLDQVVQYASVMTSPLLKTIQTKTGAALHTAKVGVERGLLAWLLGFISAELLSRGITSPKRRHEVAFPENTGYRLRVKETGEQLPRHGFHKFTPTKTVPEPLPKFKRHRMRKAVKRAGAATILPIGALLALRVLRERKREGYAFGPAAMKVGRGLKWGFKHPKVTKLLGKKASLPARAGSFVRRRPGTVAGAAGGALALRELRKIRKQRAKQGYSFRSAIKKTAKITRKVGGVAGKTLGVASNIAIPALILSELWPKKRQVGLRPMRPPVQSQPYGLTKGLKRLLQLRKGKTPPVLGQKLRDLALSRKDPALAELNKRLAAAAQKMKKFQLYSSKKERKNWGVFAGLSPKQRSRALKKLAREIAGTSVAAGKGMLMVKAYPMLLALAQEHPLVAGAAGGLALRSWSQKQKHSFGGESIQLYPMRSKAQRRWMHMKHPKMAKEWEEKTPEGKELPEHVSKHQWSALAALGGVAGVAALAGKLGHRRKMKERAGKKKPIGAVGHLARLSLLGPAVGPYYVGRGLAARKKIPENVSKHALPILVQRAVTHRVGPELAKTIRIARLRQKWNRTLLANAAIAAGTIGLATSVGLKARREKEKVSKHALQVPLLWRHLRSARQLRKARVLGRDITQWGREMAARMRTLAASTPGQNITIKGVSTSAPAWFGKEAAKWDTVASQAKDMVLKGQLEKVGLLAAAAGAGAAGHEVGKKRERARVHKVVG